MKRGLLLSFAALLICSCSSSSNQGNNNVSLPLPDALIKGAATGSLEAHLVATNGTESQQSTLTISGGTVSGTLMLAPGAWTIEIQFFEVASSGNLLPIAFIDFGSKEMGQGGLELSYVPTDIRFSESNGISASLSPTVAPPSGCVSRFDCDGDGVSNFDEMKGGSDPEDPKSLPVAPSVSAPPPESPAVAPPTITVSINDRSVGEETTVVQGIVKISAIASSAVSSSVTLASVEVKGSGLEQGSLLSDGNALPQTFDVSWDTKTVDGGEDQEYTLTFTAQDAEKRVTTLTRKVKIDNVPNIVSFGASRLIQAGQSAALTWDVSNFTSLSIDDAAKSLTRDNGIGDVSSVKSLSVSPATTTTYRLTASRKGTVKTFTITQDVTITVNHNPAFVGHTTTTLGQDPKSANGVILSFDRSDVDGDILTSTVTVYKGTTCSGSPVSTQTTTTGSANVAGLDPQTDYSYTVSLSDGRGGSGSGACQSFTTADTGLVGWWRMDEGLSQLDNCETGNQTTADSSGNNNTGTLFNTPCWTNGVAGSALEFNSVGGVPQSPLEDDVVISNESAFDTLMDCAHPISFSWWDFSTGTVGHRGVISKSEVGKGFATNVHWRNSDLSFNCNSEYGGGPPPQLSADARGALSTSQWHHYTVTYDGSFTCAGVRIYKDGVSLPLTCNSQTLATAVTNDGPVRIGVGPAIDVTDQYWFQGRLDDVALYNRALSTAEIRDSCQRNDPTGSTCATDDVPDQVTPQSSLTLPPTRAFVSWKPGATPAGKMFDHYQLCYATNGSDITSQGSCLNPTSRTVPYFILESLTASNTGYRWKVRTCYNAAGTDCSAYSPVWSFSTDNSVVAWYKLNNDLKDSGPNNYDGTPVGTSNPLFSANGNLCNDILVSDLMGQNDYAACFDGVDDFVTLSAQGANYATNLAVSSTADLSIEARFSPSDVSGSDTLFFLGGSDQNPRFLIEVGASIYTDVTDSNGQVIVISGGSNSLLRVGTFYHTVVSYDGSSGDSSLSLFLDGAPVADNDSTGRREDPRPLSFASTDFGVAEIGARTVNTPPGYFRGLVDEVIIYHSTVSLEADRNSYCAIEALAGTNPLPGVCQ